MSVGPSLVDQLLAQEGEAFVKQRMNEALLMVEKFGGREWRFEAGRFQVRLDFMTKSVTITHDAGDREQTDLDLLLRRLQISF